MKHVHFDCHSGAAGDMLLGAIIDAGADLTYLRRQIDSLGVADLSLEIEQVKRCGLRATKVNIRHPEQKSHRHLSHIRKLIEASRLARAEQELALRIFTRLGEAEARVHGTTLEKVHFHEVGALDSIADIVGIAVVVTQMGLNSFSASPIATGFGTIQIDHGIVPVPAPATAELLKGIPVRATEIEAELTTPTGAAVLSTLVTSFGPHPPMNIEAIGCGAGTKDFKTQANLVRVLMGQRDVVDPTDCDSVWIVETNLDDATGEWIGHCQQRLFEAGALDVSVTPVMMKKNRPGSKITAICHAGFLHAVRQTMLGESTSLGVRFWQAERRILPRDVVAVSTPWGTVTGKSISLPTGEKRFHPEFDECQKLAFAAGVGVIDVYQHALAAFIESQRSQRTTNGELPRGENG